MQLPLFAPLQLATKEHRSYAQARRPEMLVERYIGDRVFARVQLIDDVIKAEMPAGEVQELFNLALTAILVPASNIKYGPGFGVGPEKQDEDVFGMFATKLNQVVANLALPEPHQRETRSNVFLGDSRELTKWIEPESVALMITSPPYPGDHEYTKHSRLELIFRGHATTLAEFQAIKRRMLRASTTNLYKEDQDRVPIADMESIRHVTDLIQTRLDHDGATSGFEKLYTKLVWEYFGGMYYALCECLEALRPGGKIALLVSDSHAFKMVHKEPQETPVL